MYVTTLLVWKQSSETHRIVFLHRHTEMGGMCLPVIDGGRKIVPASARSAPSYVSSFHPSAHLPIDWFHTSHIAFDQHSIHSSGAQAAFVILFLPEGLGVTPERRDEMEIMAEIMVFGFRDTDSRLGELKAAALITGEPCALWSAWREWLTRGLNQSSRTWWQYQTNDISKHEILDLSLISDVLHLD